VRAQFLRPPGDDADDGGPGEAQDEAPPIVGAATWTGAGVVIEPGADPETQTAIQRVFRPVPVIVDDPSLRPLGASGPTLLEPGDLRWFLAAARTRASAEGLAVRFVPPGRGIGWDPAGAYRTFQQAVDRR